MRYVLSLLFFALLLLSKHAPFSWLGCLLSSMSSSWAGHCNNNNNKYTPVCHAAEVIVSNYDNSHPEDDMIVSPSSIRLTDSYDVYDNSGENSEYNYEEESRYYDPSNIHQQHEYDIYSDKTPTKTKEKSHEPMARSYKIGTLRPLDLPEPMVYDNWIPPHNQSITLQVISSTTGVKYDRNIIYASGAVPQYHQPQSDERIQQETTAAVADITFSVLPSLVSYEEVQSILQLLRNYHKDLDDDPDTVDGMPSYEIFVDNINIDEEQPSVKFRDYTDKDDRRILRQKLQKILYPIIQERITPFIRWRYPHLCNKDKNRLCIACYSLIRRYRHGERVSHGPHHDGHAIVTAVTSLSDYDKNYRGGLYVVSPNALMTDSIMMNETQTTYSSRSGSSTTSTTTRRTTKNNLRFLGLNSGDVAIHTSALLHGVKVYPKVKKPTETERWSWILWFRDSGRDDVVDDDDDDIDPTNHNDALQRIRSSCRDYDYSSEWFRQCAITGDPICQQLHATKVGTPEEVVKWNMKAANHGAGTAAVKIARAYLKQLSSYLPYNHTKATYYYQKSIEYHNNPEGHYGMAQLLIQSVADIEEQKNQYMIPNYMKWKKGQLQQAIDHLEIAAISGHVFAMFNLGIAHTYGYGIYQDSSDRPIIDMKLASEWFLECGLPEGYYTVSFYYAEQRNKKLQEKYLQLASTLGFNAPWRKQARQHTGSGGIGGVDLNIHWPIAHDGRIPPTF